MTEPVGQHRQRVRRGPRIITITPNADGSWAAYIGPDAFDLMKGVGVSLFQYLPAGARVRTTFPVPNPRISIWDTHGVAAQGWKPNTPLHLSLTNPGEGQTYEWTVTTDKDGNFWDVPPDESWQVLQPGWIATGTGSVENRETATLTKTITLPDPIPFPTTMAGNVVSGTLPGTLSAQTVGRGSYLNVTAVCRGSNWPQRAGAGRPGHRCVLTQLHDRRDSQLGLRRGLHATDPLLRIRHP